MDKKQILRAFNAKKNFMCIDEDHIDFVSQRTFGEHGEELSIGKVHIIADGEDDFGNDKFITLCGVEDTCGNWPYSCEDWFDEEDGCKKCLKVYNAARLDKKECKV